MDDMAGRFANRGVTSVFIYTREAHPAEHHREHRAMEGKRTNANAFREHCGVSRKILLDDLEGTVHRAYGLLPNMAWIVARGLILYKASWTVAADVENALERSFDFLAQRRSEGLRNVYSERLAWRPDQSESFRAGLERNGPQAVRDFYGSRS